MWVYFVLGIGGRFPWLVLPIGGLHPLLCCSRPFGARVKLNYYLIDGIFLSHYSAGVAHRYVTVAPLGLKYV